MFAPCTNRRFKLNLLYIVFYFFFNFMKRNEMENAAAKWMFNCYWNVEWATEQRRQEKRREEET